MITLIGGIKSKILSRGECVSLCVRIIGNGGTNRIRRCSQCSRNSDSHLICRVVSIRNHDNKCLRSHLIIDKSECNILAFYSKKEVADGKLHRSNTYPQDILNRRLESVVEVGSATDPWIRPESTINIDNMPCNIVCTEFQRNIEHIA